MGLCRIFCTGYSQSFACHVTPSGGACSPAGTYPPSFAPVGASCFMPAGACPSPVGACRPLLCPRVHTRRPSARADPRVHTRPFLRPSARADKDKPHIFRGEIYEVFNLGLFFFHFLYFLVKVFSFCRLSATQMSFGLVAF